MSAKEYSISIEFQIRKVRGDSYRGSDEILINPYEEIISALAYRIPQEKLDWFTLRYHIISGQKLQELLDNNYDVEQLIKDLRETVENN